MKKPNALQQLRIHAVFPNSPMLHIGYGNELHTDGKLLRTFCRKQFKLNDLEAIAVERWKRFSPVFWASTNQIAGFRFRNAD
jgi:hypothetical protein